MDVLKKYGNEYTICRGILTLISILANTGKKKTQTQIVLDTSIPFFVAEFLKDPALGFGKILIDTLAQHISDGPELYSVGLRLTKKLLRTHTFKHTSI